MRHQAKLIRMKEAGRIVGLTRQYLAGLIVPGITTGELDKRAGEFIEKEGGRAAFKGYCGFPASICVSPNEVVIHGIPGERRLLEGDIVGIDLGVEKDGFFADAAATFPVGTISAENERLISVTRASLLTALGRLKSGLFVDDISSVIEKSVNKAGFSVVKSFCGHGIGRRLHQSPEVPNFVSGNTFRLYPGLGLAIEPMVNYRGGEVKILPDGWTVVTVDGSPSAHFEETVVVLENGCEIVTQA
ncbi:MAG: type I methionyl aminopeptidase [Candidatus Ratteibacteria bacterium]|jgi:methionyl aminopeptidase